MNPLKTILLVCIGIIFISAQIGCSQFHATPIRMITSTAELKPSPAITNTPGNILTSTPQVIITNEDLPLIDPVTACDPVQQAFAMRPSSVPDWEKLEIGQCYELSLNISDDYATYTGVERFTFLNQYSQTLTDIVFRLYPNARVMYGGKLIINDVAINNIKLHPVTYLSDGTAVRISLPKPLLPGKSTSIDLNFSGTLPDINSNSRIYGIFSISHDDGPFLAMANWYPILADYKLGSWYAGPVADIGDAVVSGISLYKVNITAPKNLILATTGRQIKSRQDANEEVYDFVSGPARDFMIVASPEFVKKVVRWDDIDIDHYGLPDTESSWNQVIDVINSTFPVYTDRYGEYPYNEIDIISSPLINASGVEYPGLVLINKELYIDKSRANYLSTIAAHELSHQWWYGVVGNDALESPWQDEALATFSALLYFEKYFPKYYLETIPYYRLLVNEHEKNYPLDHIADPVLRYEDRSQAYERIVYIKGSLFFVELRKKLGDATFFKALHTYYIENAYKSVSPDVLLNSFQASCACDLTQFYKEWDVSSIP